VSQVEKFLFSSYNETLLAEQVGPDLYRLLECPFPIEEVVHYGDIVEVERQADNSLLFRRVVEPSTYRTWTCVLPRDLVDSPVIAEFCEMVRSRGGYWQRDFVGLLRLVLPFEADFDPNAWYEHRIAQSGNGRLTNMPVDNNVDKLVDF
jgi:hypothetical protein